MNRDSAYDLMLTTLRAALTTIEDYAKIAKNAPARRAAQERVRQIRDVIKHAEEAT